MLPVLLERAQEGTHTLQKLSFAVFGLFQLPGQKCLTEDQSFSGPKATDQISIKLIKILTTNMFTF